MLTNQLRMQNVDLRMLINSSFNICHSSIVMAWHIRYDWSFTPFVVVVGGKYFLPVPDCLLFDRNSLTAVD